MRKRFHLLYALRYLRYGLLLCLIPMVRALLAFRLDAFWTALGQDAVILAVFAALALALWSATGFWLTADTIETESGFLMQNHYAWARASLAALEVSRPLYCRLLGASRVVLYFKNYSAPATFTLYLHKKDAAKLAQDLMPVKSDASVFAPAGFERLTFAMLSANVLTSCAFVYMALHKANDFVDQDLEALAKENLSRLAQLAGLWLPAGLSALAALCFMVVSVTFLYAFLHTMHFSVCRNGGVLISRGGFVTKIERRIRIAAVTACEVRVTPVARLLRRYPVYVSAGSFSGGDIPVLVYKKGAEQMPQALLPSFAPPDGPLCEPGRKSPVQYLWKPGVLLALSLGMSGVALASMPALLPVLNVPVLLSFFGLLVSLEGMRREGLRKNANRTLSICYTRFFTRHEVCVLTSDLSFTLFETPFAVSAGRCDVTVNLPCRRRLRVRGVLRYAVQAIPFTL